MKLRDLQEWLDGEEFNNIAYKYRSIPLSAPPEAVIEAFEDLKLHIVKKIIELS